MGNEMNLIQGFSGRPATPHGGRSPAVQDVRGHQGAVLGKRMDRLGKFQASQGYHSLRYPQDPRVPRNKPAGLRN